MGWAETIKRIRESHGLSQRELAKAIGVHPTGVSKWERGFYEPGQVAQWKLSKLEESAPLKEDVPDVDIRYVLYALDVNQSELARMIGVSQSFVNQWKLDKAPIPSKHRKKIHELMREIGAGP